MEEETAFEVRLSRQPLLLYTLVGLLFLLIGLDWAFFRFVFDAEIAYGRPVFRWVFTVSAISVGLLMTGSGGLYLIMPPVLMRVSREGISFGTGLLYRPTLIIALKYLKSVEIYQGLNSFQIGRHRKVTYTGVELRFRKTEQIPSRSKAAIGIEYADYCLRLKKRYMNRSLRETMRGVKEFIQRNRSESSPPKESSASPDSTPPEV